MTSTIHFIPFIAYLWPPLFFIKGKIDLVDLCSLSKNEFVYPFARSSHHESLQLLLRIERPRSSVFRWRRTQSHALLIAQTVYDNPPIDLPTMNHELTIVVCIRLASGFQAVFILSYHYIFIRLEGVERSRRVNIYGRDSIRLYNYVSDTFHIWPFLCFFQVITLFEFHLFPKHIDRSLLNNLSSSGLYDILTCQN